MMAGRGMDVNSGGRNRHAPGCVATDVNPDHPPRAGPASPPRSQAESAARLASLHQAAAKEFRRQQRADRRSITKRPGGRRPWWRSVLLVLALALLPFVALVRMSVWSYEAFGAPTWLALGAGALFTLVIVAVYGARISARLTGKARVRLAFTHVALPITLVYFGYALVYLSSANAKSEAVATWSSPTSEGFRPTMSPWGSRCARHRSTTARPTDTCTRSTSGPSVDPHGATAPPPCISVSWDCEPYDTSAPPTTCT